MGRPQTIVITPGQVFGRLTVLTEFRVPGGPGFPLGRRRARCACSCGAETTVSVNHLGVSGGIRSCGCLKRERNRSPESRARLTEWNRSPENLAHLAELNRSPENLARARQACTTHALSSHPLYGTHRQMLRRTENPKHTSYKNYGAMGISVCPEWHDVTNFVTWVEEHLGPRPEGYSLDRWPNPDGDYTPGNVQWSSPEQQNRHKGPDKSGSSRFKGVSLFKQTSKWRAQITVDGEHRNLGMFDVEEHAAKAYDHAAFEAWGSDCWLNTEHFDLTTKMKED